MERDDICAIFKVCLPPQTSTVTVDQIDSIDVLLILDNLRRRELLPDEQFYHLKRKYLQGCFGENAWREFLMDMWRTVSFDEFVCALHDSEYYELCRVLQVERRALMKQPEKHALSNDDRLVTFYTHFRKKVDDGPNSIVNKNHLESIILQIASKIGNCSRDQGKLQMLLDLRTVAYYIFAQKHLNISERNEVMKRMRDVMLKGFDRTVLDVTFHSLMSINCAIQGNDISSEEHEKLVMQIRIRYNSRFVEIISSFGSLYKNDVLFLCSRSDEYLTKAKNEFSRGMTSTVDMSSEEGTIQRNVALVEHARCLLGINLNFTVCDITDVKTGYIQRARDVLGVLEDNQLSKRRKMKFLFSKGRLNELCNVSTAVEYVRQASELADDNTELENMNKYVEYLQTQSRPHI